ncbi:MAG: YceI family protein [Leptospiraceae bacterium]|nr:YceI family protein [Leptospiraceae bacterium]
MRVQMQCWLPWSFTEIKHGASVNAGIPFSRTCQSAVLFYLAGLIYILAATSGLSAQAAGGTITFTVNHPMKTVNGTVRNFSWPVPEIKNDDCPILAAPLQFTIPATSLFTDNRNRDSHLLEVLKYPIHKLILVKLTASTCSAQSKTSAQAEIQGSVQIAGITRSFRSAAVLQRQTVDQPWKAAGQLNLSLQAFDLKAPELLFMPIEDAVHINWQLPLDQ